MDKSAPGVWGLYCELWRFAEGRRVQLVSSFALLIASQLAKLAVPALAGTALNTIQSQGVAGAGRAGVLRLVASRLSAVFEPVRRSIVFNEAKWASVDLLNTALWIALVTLFVWLSIRETDATQTIALGSLFMVYEYALQAGGVITGIAAHFQSLARQQTDFGSAAPIRALPVRPTATDAQARAVVHAAVAAGGWREMEFSGLDYSHPLGEAADPQAGPRAIREMRVRLRRGRRYALIGPSGSGKTTLLRLLAGLYVPRAGHLVIDGGQPIGAVRMPDLLQDLVTLLPQDADLFGGSVRENLLLAIGDDEQVQPSGEGLTSGITSALAVAQAMEFLAKMPLGIDSPVAARGGNLSGGQRQRIAIARALLAAASSSMLLLDEPTSALDPATEAALIKGLMAARIDACIVASIHRPQLLDVFDEVLVVNAGRLVDQGTVAELAPRCAELAAFLRLQPPAVGSVPSPAG